MMTKKQFKAIAEVISDLDSYEHQDVIVISKRELIWRLREFFELENKLFDVEKFEEACYE